MIKKTAMLLLTLVFAVAVGLAATTIDDPSIYKTRVFDRNEDTHLTQLCVLTEWRVPSPATKPFTVTRSACSSDTILYADFEAVSASPAAASGAGGTTAANK